MCICYIYEYDYSGQVGFPGQLSPVAELDAAAGQAGGAAAGGGASPGVPSVAQLFPPPPVPHRHPAARHQDDHRATQGLGCFMVLGWAG